MKRVLLLALLALVFVPSAVSKPRAAQILLNAASPSGSASTTVPLHYWGGPVMRGPVTLHMIYWQPPGTAFPDNYRASIDRFISDVAADSGRMSNFYSVLTEYYDKTGPISYAMAAPPSLFVNDPMPSCTNAYAHYCVSTRNAGAEIKAVMTRFGLPHDFANAYVLVTPPDVAIGASYVNFCGIHDFDYSLRPSLIYALIPYQNWMGRCLAASSPSGNGSVDKAVSVISHELSEMVTDPENGSAWYSAQSGGEVADICNTNYGSSLGSTQYGFYNQIINGDSYYLQGEWSNARSACEWGR